jgi:hypothetical protein
MVKIQSKNYFSWSKYKDTLTHSWLKSKVDAIAIHANNKPFVQAKKICYFSLRLAVRR